MDIQIKGTYKWSRDSVFRVTNPTSKLINYQVTLGNPTQFSVQPTSGTIEPNSETSINIIPSIALSKKTDVTATLVYHITPADGSTNSVMTPPDHQAVMLPLQFRLGTGAEPSVMFRMKNQNAQKAWRAIVIVNVLSVCIIAHGYFILTGEANSFWAKVVTFVSLFASFISWAY